MDKKWYLLGASFLFVFSILITIGTYARFQSSVTGTGQLVTASWNFEVNDESSYFTNELLNLYPGASGSFDLKLSAIGSDLPVSYVIHFNDANNIPANLSFYSNSTKTESINTNGGSISGTLSAGTEKIVTIYYDWPYGTTVEEYSSEDLNFKISIVGIQVNPNGGE